MSHVPSFTESDLQAYYRRIDLINQTANQIIKDFEWYGMEIKFSGKEENAYHELFDQIEPAIQKLLNSDSEKLMEVLYRIDVNEKKATVAAENAADKNKRVSESLTELIIQRELQKIVIRNYFSGRL